MKSQKRTDPSESSRRANTMIRRRVLALTLVFGMATFLALFWKLWQIQIIDHNFYAQKAVANQTRDLAVSAKRGNIVDSKGKILAMSATVHNVVLSPKEIAEKEMDVNLIADGLSEILELDREVILERAQRLGRQYEKVASKIEDDLEQQVRAFIVNNKLSGGVLLEVDTKRYYPTSSLAAQVVGFVDSENTGAYGLEAIYEADLSGQKGRIVTSKTGSGLDMLSSYESYVDAEDGYNLNLTIDYTIQSYARRIVEEGIEKFEAQSGFCIVMDPNTGAILAMVSLPDYDLNDPSTVTDKAALSKIAEKRAALDAAKLAAETAVNEDGTPIDEETKATKEAELKNLETEYLKAISDAQLAQWRNKTVNDTYEPGSTFKPITLAMALEEGLVTESSSFYCGGKITVPGWPLPVKCHNHNGHGSQDLRKVLMNSCNPALVQIGQKIGNDAFFEYMQDFGLLNTTGVDLNGEGYGDFWPASEFKNDIVSLSVASFGQRFQVTPIGLITALSAVINGGHLVEPYTVQSITDADGNVISYHDVKEVRQVISQETSDLVRDMMRSVVCDGGTGKNAYVEGYQIGGKTGTSQTLVPGELIVSFTGFAPADNPEFVVLLAYDKPKPAAVGASSTAGGYYISGGNMAAVMAGELIAEILDYMGVQKQGSEAAQAIVQNLSGKTLGDAQSILSAAGLTWKVVGSGETVTGQTPAVGTSIPSGSAVVLYMGAEKAGTKVEVPDLSGKTYNAAKSLLESKGLYMEATEVENSSKILVFSQSVNAGALVESGRVIEVRFMDKTVQDYAG